MSEEANIATDLPDTLTPQAEARLLEFTKSDLFTKTFKEGMALVEEVAAYLDGPGRYESKKLDRKSALLYASQSMKLTTDLLARSEALYERISRLDRSLYGTIAAQSGNTVADQISRLHAAFGDL